MLTAFDIASGAVLVLPDHDVPAPLQHVRERTRRRGELLCPVCKQLLALRAGTVRVWCGRFGGEQSAQQALGAVGPVWDVVVAGGTMNAVGRSPGRCSTSCPKSAARGMVLRDLDQSPTTREFRGAGLMQLQHGIARRRRIVMVLSS